MAASQGYSSRSSGGGGGGTSSGGSSFRYHGGGQAQWNMIWDAASSPVAMMAASSSSAGAYDDDDVSSSRRRRAGGGVASSSDESSPMQQHINQPEDFVPPTASSLALDTLLVGPLSQLALELSLEEQQQHQAAMRIATTSPSPPEQEETTVAWMFAEACSSVWLKEVGKSMQMMMKPTITTTRPEATETINHQPKPMPPPPPPPPLGGGANKHPLVRLRMWMNIPPDHLADGGSCFVLIKACASATTSSPYTLTISLPTNAEAEDLSCKPHAKRTQRPDTPTIIFDLPGSLATCDGNDSSRWVATCLVRFRVSDARRLRGYRATARLRPATTTPLLSSSLNH
ncbi:hypothetical protein NFJ02_14g18630 [Pycnococcus provasolii]